MVQDNGYDGYETCSNKGRLDKARRRPKKPVRDWEEGDLIAARGIGHIV